MEQSHHQHEHATKNNEVALDRRSHSIKDYLPLVTIVVFVVTSSSIHIQLIGSTLANWMAVLMGYFFIYFSLFKLIDLPGFLQDIKNMI